MTSVRDMWFRIFSIALISTSILQTPCKAEWVWTSERSRMTNEMYYEKTFTNSDNKFNVAVQCHAYKHYQTGSPMRFYKIIFGTIHFLGEGAPDGRRITSYRFDEEMINSAKFDYTDYHAMYNEQEMVESLMVRLKSAKKLIIELTNFRHQSFIADFHFPQPETENAINDVVRRCLEDK